MKKGIYLTIISTITIACIIFGSCYHLTDWKNPDFFRPLQSADTDTKQESLPSFDAITLECDVAQVRIQTGEEYRISYECDNLPAPTYQVTDGTLKVTQYNKSSNIFNLKGNKECSIVITLPEGASLTSINGESDVGDVEIEHITCKKLEMTCDVGNIELSNSKIDSIICVCDVGDCNIQECTFLYLDITNDVGDVSVHSTNPLSEYSMELSADIGEISVNGREEDRHYTQDGDNDQGITITNEIGDIDVTD